MLCARILVGVTQAYQWRQPHHSRQDSHWRHSCERHKSASWWLAASFEGHITSCIACKATNLHAKPSWSRGGRYQDSYPKSQVAPVIYWRCSHYYALLTLLCKPIFLDFSVVCGLKGANKCAEWKVMRACAHQDERMCASWWEDVRIKTSFDTHDICNAWHRQTK